MQKNKCLLAGIIFLLFMPFLNAQDILWEKSYGGLQSEYLFDVIPTPDYGFLIAGSSLSGKSGNKRDERVNDLDYWLWKMDEHGNLDWQRSFGGDGSDLLQSIELTPDGGFILGGTSTSGKSGIKDEKSRGKEDMWIIKLNAKGDLEWQRTLGGSGRDELKQIISVTQGGYLVGGSSDSYPLSLGDKNTEGEKFSKNYGNMDYWIVKLDFTGEVEWEKTFGGIYREELQSVIQTKDDGFLVGGTSNSPISGNKKEKGFGQGDYWIIKLDEKGNEQWQKTIGGENDDRLATVIERSNGEYILGGSSSSGIDGNKYKSNGKGTDFWLVGLNSKGQITWQETYDFEENDVLTSLVENEDGGLLIGGHAKSERGQTQKATAKNVDDYIILLLDSEKNERWRTTVGRNGTDILKKAIEIYDGGYLLTGISSGKISRDRNSGYGRFDFWVIKLKDKEKEEKDRIPGLKAWPNPTQTYTNVIVNHDFEKATVYVYDILGREVQRFKADQRTIPVNMDAHAEGIYIVRVETDVKTQSIKIIRGLKKR